MSNVIDAKDIREQVSLAGLLGRLGYQPQRSSGQEQLYISMLRDSDTDPSFAVNDQLGVWFDHGEGRGGNIIDFAIAYWPNLSFKEVLAKIVDVSSLPLVQRQTADDFSSKRRHALRVPHYHVQDVKELGNNPAITEYLKQRGVWEMAQGRLKEVYYYVEDEKKRRKNFFAAGWQNEVGAWEVRNKYFKGCLGHKGLTIVPGNTEKLSLFEGYINYLSWLTEHPKATDTILVLNSLALLNAGIKTARDFSLVDTYFDRDRSGEKASKTFNAAIPQSVDRSDVYKGYNDYNDLRKATIRAVDELTNLNATDQLFRSAFKR